MRIIHVVASAFPGNIKGDETHVLYLAGKQLANGEDPVVLTDRDGLAARAFKQEGIPVSVIDDLVPGGRSVATTTALGARLREFNTEILHCHEVPLAPAAVRAANTAGIPCVTTLHVGSGEDLHSLAAANSSGRKLAVIAVARKQYDAMGRVGLSGIEPHYVPLGTKVVAARHQPASRAAKPSLILVGALDFRKGIDLAILAMHELRRKRGTHCPVLNIYGWGPLGRYFVEMTKVLQLDELIKFHGVKLGVLENCARSDVLIVPSRHETGPLVVVEAMSRGMPIVAADVGNVREMLPNRQYGRIVLADSITGLSDAIDSILRDVASGQFNPSAVINRHRSEYSAEKMAEQVAVVYQSALRS